MKQVVVSTRSAALSRTVSKRGKISCIYLKHRRTLLQTRFTIWRINVWYTAASAVCFSLALRFRLIIHFSSTELREGLLWRWATQGLKQTINHYGSLFLENCTDRITCRSTAAPRWPRPVLWGLKITVSVRTATVGEGEDERTKDTERERDQWDKDEKQRQFGERANSAYKPITNQSSVRRGFLGLNAGSRNSYLVLSAGWHCADLAGWRRSLDCSYVNLFVQTGERVTRRRVVQWGKQHYNYGARRMCQTSADNFRVHW